MSLDRWSYALVIGGLGVAAMVLLAAPTLIVLITSLTSGETLRFPPPGFSARWYEALIFSSPDIVDAAIVSLKVAAGATLSATALATAAAVGIASSDRAWARVAETALMSPLLFPALSLALGLLLDLQCAEYRRFAGDADHRTRRHWLPVRAAHDSGEPRADPSALEECARDLGAGGWQTFVNVTLPLARGGIIAGAFIGFMASFDNVAISLFLADARSEVLPIRLWDLIESVFDVRAAAASGVLIVTTVALMIVIERIAGLSRYVR